MDRERYTIRQATARTGFGYQTIWQAIAHGELEAYRTSPRGHWRIPHAALIAWADSHSNRTVADG